VERRGGPGPIYRRSKAVRRGGGFFRREIAGELARLLDVRPDFTATGDGTARAAAGQLVQGQRVQGRSGAGGLRWW
jgi:hypothetical protein